MRIGLVGDFTEPRDEGQKGVARHLALELSRRHEVTELSVTSVFASAFWCKVRQSELEVVHYVPGPTIKSLAVCKMVAAFHGARIVVSALQPRFTAITRRLIPFLQPDLVLVQSGWWGSWFEAQGCSTSLVPNGVDTDRFSPVSAEQRRELRSQFRIPRDSFLVLHVGHITRWRNVEALARIQENGRQVLMVASEYARADGALRQLLRDSGCLVIEGYVPNLEQIYAMSDCYVFPVRPGDTILTPLSVLEAMACNLPVITRRFEGLEELFADGEGLHFVDSDDDLLGAVQALETGSIKVRTRDKVAPYSWRSVANQVEQLYQELLGGP